MYRLPDLPDLDEYVEKYISERELSFVSWRTDGRLLSASAGFYRLTGYSPEAAQGMSWPRNFLTERSTVRVLSALEHLGLERDAERVQAEILRSDGSTVPMVLEMVKFRTEPGSAPAYMAYLRSIAEEKRMYDKLLMSQMAIDLFSDSSLWTDDHGRLIYANRRAAESLGYSEDELKAMKIWDIDPNYSPERYLKMWGDIKAAGWLKFDTIHETKDGHIIPVEVTASYLKYGEQELLISFDRDITERRRAEEALLESEELFRVLTKTSLAAVFLVQNNKFIYANPQGLKTIGYTYDEIVGKNFWEPIHPEFKESMKEYGEMLLHGKRIPGRFEIKFLRKNGEEGWCDLIVAPIKYRGMAAGVITALDITSRKKSEIALKESEEKFRVLSELSPTAIFMYQGDRLIYANPAATGFTGFSEAEIKEKEFWEMVHPRYRELVKQYGLARQRGEAVPSRYEIMYVTKSGEQRWAQFTAGEIEYRGRPAGIVTAIDTTERKNSEIALRQAKQEAELYVDLMGHDINNMNQIALGFLELVETRLAAGGSLESSDQQLVASAIESLQGSSSLIATVRKLRKERKGGYQSQIIDVQEVLNGVKAQFAHVPGRTVRIDIISKHSCKVRANELLKDVFVNLIGNSIKHSQGDLSIFISTEQVVEEGNLYCQIEIEDTGPGIPDETKKTIFDLSKKEKGIMTGKGLGLYLVQTLVADYKGKIWVEDRVKGDYRKGCRFIVLLPVDTEEPFSSTSEASA